MRFNVTILGCGAAIPLTHRNPTAQLVNVNEQLFLFDCAEGTQVQLRRARVRMQKINHIFISHLHGDHYFGLIGLITSLHLLGRESPLHIYAHPDLEQIIEIQLSSSQTILRYELVFHGIDPYSHSLILDNSAIEVHTIPMHHNFPTAGFLIREKQAKPNIRKDFVQNRDLANNEYKAIKEGSDYVDKEGRVYRNSDITIPPRVPRAYAFCSDTAYNEKLVPVLKGVDLLYHEATFMDDRKADAEAKFHATASQAAAIASKAGVKRLIIGHYSARYRELEGLLAEAQNIFPDTILAEDGLVVDIP